MNHTDNHKPFSTTESLGFFLERGADGEERRKHCREGSPVSEGSSLCLSCRRKHSNRAGLPQEVLS